jgi:hypothetical protein
MGELYLRKDEVPISRVNSFFMPVHPRLLDNNLSIDETIAQETFLTAVDEWWEEIRTIKKEYHYIPDEKPKIEQGSGTYTFLGWESNTEFFDNGFAYCFAIAREDGSMFYNHSDINCTLPMRLGMHIDKEKEKEFINPVNQRIHAYTFHNLNSFPAALLLRNWSINYMNEVFKKYL